MMPMFHQQLPHSGTDIRCVWEHNGSDTLLYALDYPGAFARGDSLEAAKEKMPGEIRSYTAWLTGEPVQVGQILVCQDAPCSLTVRDADSDVLLHNELAPLSREEYLELKAVALKSAEDFHTLYASLPAKEQSDIPLRQTFYGQVPRTPEEMYRHTRNVNAYYFGEINVAADNEGTIVECRRRGFEQLEQQPDFLKNMVVEGSYTEQWTLRKVLRRFIWHDRIHAKAMYRMAIRLWEKDRIPDPFCWGSEIL